MKCGATIFKVFLLLASVYPVYSVAQSTSSLETDLAKQLARITSQLITNKTEMERLKGTNRNLQEEIELLEREIDRSNLEIQAAELTLGEITYQAARLQKEINILQKKIDMAKEKLTRNFGELYQLDQRSFVEIIFSKSGFSDFFNQIQYLRELQNDLKGSLEELSRAKEQLDEVEEELREKLVSQERLLTLQRIEYQEIDGKKEKKARLIKTNTLQASSLEGKNSALEETARQIQERLYIIKGLTKSVGLDDAHSKAANVAGKVGISPAFLMAVLKVESDLGGNVGGGNWQKDMHPRDKDAFLQITRGLNLDPDKVPVSSAPKYGWGGAIGPAQFLPKTWLSYQSRVAEITGHNPPNPWDLEDAFAAAGVKLAGNGANRATKEGEREAAMRYFAGGRWQNPAYSFYGDRVMTVKDLIEGQFRS